MFVIYAFLIAFPVIFLLIKKDAIFYAKYYWKIQAIRKRRSREKLLDIEEKLVQIDGNNPDMHFDNQLFYATDHNGNKLTIKLSINSNLTASATIYLRLQNGKTYVNSKKNENVQCIENISISKPEWYVNGLKIEVSQPFARLRISFNGLLQNMDEINEEYVSFSFIFNCSGAPNILLLNDDFKLLGTAISKSSHSKWTDILNYERGYVQFGALKGQIKGETFEEFETNMSCVRKRFWGRNLDNVVSIFATTDEGYLVYLENRSINGTYQREYGYVYSLRGTTMPIQSLKSNFSLKSKDGSDLNNMELKIKVGNQMISCNLHIHQKRLNFVNNLTAGSKSTLMSADCSVNDSKGSALLELWSSFKGTEMEKPVDFLKPIECKELPKTFAIDLNNEDAKITRFVGGKATSLALMKSLKSEKYIVPNGFVVTSHAFDNFSKKIFKDLCYLRDVSCGIVEGDLKDSCARTMEIIKNSHIEMDISMQILEQIDNFKSVFNGKNHDITWAVRSSATWEDSEESSAAGQNETFLCCKSKTEILNRVKDCWASMFSYQSVEYRRQHGIPIISKMAVVVQEMVPSEIAGVMFTCHPSNGNPSKIVITANYGLGETVVSGESEPDTVILKKLSQNLVDLESVEIGSKMKTLKVTDSSLENIENSALDIEKLCMSKEQAVILGNVGLLLEQKFGSHRDIEWAFFKDKLYLLQCRPITAINQWTDYDLLHEFDTPHLSKYTYYTRANVGEVLPFPLTVLTQTTLIKKLQQNLQERMYGSWDEYSQKPLLCSHHFSFLDVIKSFYIRPTKPIEMANKVADFTIFGHQVINEELNDIAIKVNGEMGKLQKFGDLAKAISTAFKCIFYVKNMWKKVADCHVDIKENDDSLEIYQRIVESLEKFVPVCSYHCEITEVSVFLEIMTMIIMMEGSEELSMEHHHDLALILSSCENVISASVPQMQKDIALLIKKCGKTEEFCNLKEEDCMIWLENNVPEAFKLLELFMELHGHRTIGELELAEDTWSSKTAILKILQTMVVTVEEKSSVIEKSNIMKELKTPKNKITRIILRLFMGLSQWALRNREYSKSGLVKSGDVFRKSYRTLAKKMVNTGILPHENLIFHLSQYELLRVIQGDSSLINKAKRRHRLYTDWKKLEFPEISYGAPKPENLDDFIVTFDENQIFCFGTPASSGEVSGRACVITSLDEIGILQKGDILITKSTDIGWSPYFPLLSGIVTELGGIVSHGAVVAREYGLPCLIGTKHATKMFKTGNNVFLSGKTGKLHLI